MALVHDFWDDAKLSERSDSARLLYAHLVSCRENESVQGLICHDAWTLAKRMRWLEGPERVPDAKKARAVLRELEEHGFIETDAELELIRVPRAPFYPPPCNASHLRGWFGKWQRMPKSRLRLAHVASIRAACEHKRWFTEALWAETFGMDTVSTPSAHRVDTVSPTVSRPSGGRWGTPPGSGSGSESPLTSPSGAAEAAPLPEPLDAVWGKLFEEATRTKAALPVPGHRLTHELLNLSRQLGRGEVVARMRRFLADPRRPATRKTLDWFTRDVEGYGLAAGSSSPAESPWWQDLVLVNRLAEVEAEFEAKGQRPPWANDPRRLAMTRDGSGRELRRVG
jgi:hypothetical protein